MGLSLKPQISVFILSNFETGFHMNKQVWSNVQRTEALFEQPSTP